MKIKKEKAAKPAERKMTDAEIKEAIKRDKEWMDRIDPDEEIEVPKDIFEDIKRKFDDEDADADQNSGSEGSAGEIDDEDDNDGDDDNNDGDCGGKMVGALIGGIGGLVLGSVLGAALWSDD